MSFRFGILCFPGVQQLDLTGPYEVFASARDAQVDLVWKTTDPVRASTGLWLTPDVAFADDPNFDLICVPGGGGVNPLLTDEETLDFVKSQAKTARFVTSVCRFTCSRQGRPAYRKAGRDALECDGSAGAVRSNSGGRAGRS